MNPLTEIVQKVNAAVNHLRGALERDALEKERAQLMKPFTNAWKYAPAIERERALKKIIADQERRAGEALYALGRCIRDEEPIVTSTIEALKQAPSPEQAWARRAGEVGFSADVYLGIYQLDEARQIRLTAELRTAPPSEWLSTYDRAVADSTEQENASTIRVIERLLSRVGWPGNAADPEINPRERAAILALRRRVSEVREARVPAELRAAEAALTSAKNYERQVETLHKILPINPELQLQAGDRVQAQG